MREENVFISGATGLIGRNIIKTIIDFNSLSDSIHYNVIAAVRDIDKAKAILEFMSTKDKIEYYVYHNDESINYPKHIDHLIYASGVTDKASIFNYPVETYLTNCHGIYHFLQYAITNRIKSLIYLSSAVIYGKDDDSMSPYYESYVGKTDSSKNAYIASKQTGEFLCNSYYTEYDIPTRIARIFQVYGDVSGSNRGTFLVDCINAYRYKTLLEVKTDGNNVRNLIHAEDAASAILRIMQYGHNGETYNVGSTLNNLKFSEIATIIASCFNDSPDRIKFCMKNDGTHDIQIPSLDKLLNLGWAEKKSCFADEIRQILNL